MHKIAIFFLLALFVLFPLHALAIDPGTANGAITIGNDVLQLKFAYAQLHDNAEGWLETAKEMRILLTDRQVPQESLTGLNLFVTLSEMVTQDKVRGLLLRFNPADPNSIVLTNLRPPKDPMEGLANKSLSYGDRSPIENFVIAGERVSGFFKLHSDGVEDLGWPMEDYAIRFSAPLFKEPVITADLSGEKALKSPQVAVLLAKCDVMGKGDIKKARQYSTDRSNAEIDTYLSQAGDNAIPMVKQIAEEQEKSLKGAKLRLVERGTRANLLIDGADGKSLIGFAKEGGAWKTD